MLRGIPCVHQGYSNLLWKLAPPCRIGYQYMSQTFPFLAQMIMCAELTPKKLIANPSLGLIIALKVSVGVHDWHREISDSGIEKGMKDNFSEYQTRKAMEGGRAIPLTMVRGDTSIVSLVRRLFTTSTWSHHCHWLSSSTIIAGSIAARSSHQQPSN
jgi:hypothetical protein